MTPKFVSAKMPAGADAERKQITALFSDISVYTAMTGQLDPEDVREITGKNFQEIKRVVARYDGFIEKFAGDGALILFGVPQAHEDDPVHAVRAAREIHDCVDAISPLYEPRLVQEFKVTLDSQELAWLEGRVIEEMRLQDLSPDNAHHMLLSLFGIKTPTNSVLPF